MPTLNFKGKSIIQNHHLTVKYHQLHPREDLSLSNNISLNDNLIIHGDNLKALKALLPNYAGRIKCIYADPPYNTGNEKWVFNDNVNSPMMQEWLGKVVDKEDLTRHDKWLCMMMPRLKLLRELLRDDGVMLISVDDNEVHNLKQLCNEVFGEDNFVNSFAWQSRTSKQNDTDISVNHEYILAFAKKRRKEDRRLKESNYQAWFNSNTFAYYPIPLDKSRFSNPDNDPRGPWKIDPFDAPNVRENLTYPIINPNTGVEYWPPNGRCWRTEEQNYYKLLEDDRIVFGISGEAKPQLKVFWEEKKLFGEIETTWFPGNERGTVTEATQQLQSMFNNEKTFDYPKPVRLIKDLLRISASKNDIMLDSFAGSGTTAHAVLDLNNEDGGNRQFILVECEDYADEITAERVRKVINGAPNARDEQLRQGYGGSFSYFELGESIEIENLIKGENLPGFESLARYVFYTATGEEFDDSKINYETGFIGESNKYKVYMLYKPDIEYLKSTALNLDFAKQIHSESNDKKNLVFAPMRFLDDKHLKEYNIDFCQLPYEIYRYRG